MKFYLFLFSLVFSSSAFASSVEPFLYPIVGGASNPFGGYYDECNSTSCILGYKDPYVYEDVLDPGQIYNDENYFSVGTDLVDREMSNGASYALEKSLRVLVEWQTYDVFDAVLSFTPFISLIDLPDNGSGKFILNLIVPENQYQTYNIGISGLANSLDSFLEVKISLYEAPIPSTFFMFVPALLGLWAYRRKLP